MRRFLKRFDRYWWQGFVFGVIVIVSIVIACRPVDGAITIDQPPRLDAGEDVDVFVHGLEYTDLPNAEVIFFPREKVRVRPSLSWGLKPFIIFRAQRPGKYLLAVSATVEGKHCYAESIIVVGEPEPPPPPPPPPVPSSPFFAVIYETKGRPGEEAVMLAGLRNYLGLAKKVPFRFGDQNEKSGAKEESAKWMRPYLKAINERKVSLPVVVIASTSDGRVSIVAVEPLRGKSAEAIAVIKKYGG